MGQKVDGKMYEPRPGLDQPLPARGALRFVRIFCETGDPWTLATGRFFTENVPPEMWPAMCCFVL